MLDYQQIFEILAAHDPPPLFGGNCRPGAHRSPAMDFVFAFKKVVSRLIFPLPLVAYPLLAGVLLLWFGKTRRKQLTGKILVTVGLALFFTFGAGPIPDLMLRSLENDYPPFALSSDANSPFSPKFVVVLGGDHTAAAELPVTSRLGPKSTARLNEGARLLRLFPEAKLIVTGGKVRADQPVAIADDMAEIAEMWGISRDSIVVENQSRDTKDHVRYLTEMLGEEPFLLVTSASHMPRAMALFANAGLNPTAAPVMFDASSRGRFGWQSFVPKASKFGRSEGAFYEYLGWVWGKLRGQI